MDFGSYFDQAVGSLEVVDWVARPTSSLINVSRLGQNRFPAVWNSQVKELLHLSLRKHGSVVRKSDCVFVWAQMGSIASPLVG